ncbi:MBL fold metallo-hydrolase [Piscinibacter sp. HJYY11]|uniref:MBL fold metallo-hydrolase n=1 Tax=Piscinibacter sp. HJYY11 TaxID=2801333 RepID=UPI00191E779D|nr:MBL fold metallo-hydrolase [Piscinibacter sp. HJYY11]MBL0727122.1 MBL fold metallo-hydrolase [Piscinibacter sp. HJYY11]
MRFCSLGSGSSGNATLIEASAGITTTRVLVDCGFSLRELERRLATRGLSAADIDAVFVTHEHGDHVGCAFHLARKHHVPVWTSRGTWRAIGQPELPEGLLHFARDLTPIQLGDLEIRPYTVPHDAHEPLQLCASDGAVRLGVLTDAGCATAHLLAQLQRCDALLLECNHDRTLLAHSAYPASLKARIGGRLGHLANDTSAEILASCLHPALKHLVAAHLSERNNRPELAQAALAAVFGGQPEEIVVADPLQGFDWLAI